MFASREGWEGREGGQRGGKRGRVKGRRGGQVKERNRNKITSEDWYHSPMSSLLPNLIPTLTHPHQLHTPTLALTLPANSN